VNNSDKVAVTLALTGMKKEQIKKTIIHKFGVDLANYENGFYTVAANLLIHLIDAKENVVREYIEWWLFEKGNKINVDGAEICVKDAESFTNFLFTLR
jgi:hypothetical protein